MGTSIQLGEVFSFPASYPDDLGLGPGPHEGCGGAGTGVVGASGHQAEGQGAVWDVEEPEVTEWRGPN